MILPKKAYWLIIDWFRNFQQNVFLKFFFKFWFCFTGLQEGSGWNAENDFRSPMHIGSENELRRHGPKSSGNEVRWCAETSLQTGSKTGLTTFWGLWWWISNHCNLMGWKLRSTIIKLLKVSCVDTNVYHLCYLIGNLNSNSPTPLHVMLLYIELWPIINL